VKSFTPFPLDALPSVVREYVAEHAALIGCDPTFIVVPLLASLGGAIGNKLVVRLPDASLEPATIWASVVHDPDALWQQGLDAATTIVQKRQQEALDHFAAAIEEYQPDLANYRFMRRAVGSRYPTSRKPTRPVEQHFVLYNVAFGELLNRLSTLLSGMLMLNDDLAGWLARSSIRMSNRTNLLNMWRGGPLTPEPINRY
jgi:hypothetical protein